jgi:hypothetical protein
LLDNYLAVVDEVIRAKPATSKGKYIKTVTVSSRETAEEQRVGSEIEVEPQGIIERGQHRLGKATDG